MEKRSKETTKEREDLKKHNLSLRERLRVLRNDIKARLDASTKNGIKTDLAPLSTPELPAPVQDETATSTPSNHVAPVSVATQTMPLVKKTNIEAAHASEDEEVNVDEITES